MTLHIDTSRADQVKIRFSWTLHEPTGVMSVVGSFNSWTPGMDELVEDSHGQRSVTLGLPYEQKFVFRYLADDGHWFDDPDADDVSGSGSVIYPIARPGATA